MGRFSKSEVAKLELDSDYWIPLVDNRLRRAKRHLHPQVSQQSTRRRLLQEEEEEEEEEEDADDVVVEDDIGVDGDFSRIDADKTSIGLEQTCQSPPDSDYIKYLEGQGYVVDQQTHTVMEQDQFRNVAANHDSTEEGEQHDHATTTIPEFMEEEPLGTADNDDYEDIDPDYAIFQKNVKLSKDGHSYTLELVTEKGRKYCIEYETEHSTDFGNECVTPDLQGDKPCQRKRGIDGDVKVKKRAVKPRRQTCLSENFDEIESRSFLEDCDPQMMALADSSYLMFLSKLQVKGHTLIYESEKGIVWSYGEEVDPMMTEEDVEEEVKVEDVDENDEESEDEDEEDENEEENKDDEDDDETEDDDEEEEDGGTPYHLPNSTPNEPIDVDVDVESASIEKYINKLIKQLQLPPTQEEYATRREVATKHTPATRHMDLRNRPVSYQTDDNTSLAYFVHYPDVADMVNLAESRNDTNRALALLRCLFFYLENAVHLKNHRPWEDIKVMEVVDRLSCI